MAVQVSFNQVDIRSCPMVIARGNTAATTSPLRIVFWTEHTYNRRRRQRALGRLTPVEYELAFTAQDAAVAA